jgi:hypothetical protein
LRQVSLGPRCPRWLRRRRRRSVAAAAGAAGAVLPEPAAAVTRGGGMGAIQEQQPPYRYGDCPTRSHAFPNCTCITGSHPSFTRMAIAVRERGRLKFNRDTGMIHRIPLPNFSRSMHLLLKKVTTSKRLDGKSTDSISIKYVDSHYHLTKYYIYSRRGFGANYL